MRIGKDTFVVLESTVKLADGTFVKGESGPVSMNFVAGYDQILPALEQMLMGVEAGETLDFVIPAARAFGERDEALVRVRSFEEFPEGRGLEPGKWVVASSDETGARYGYYVTSKSEASVTMDFNHPLAGQDLHYHVKVCLVRAVTPDELEYLRPCEQAEDEAQLTPVIGIPDRS